MSCQYGVARRDMAVTEDSTSWCARCAPLTSTLTDARLGVDRLVRKATLLGFCCGGRPSARVDKVWREVARLKDHLRDYEEALRAHRAEVHGETSAA